MLFAGFSGKASVGLKYFCIIIVLKCMGSMMLGFSLPELNVFKNCAKCLISPLISFAAVPNL